MVAPVPLAVVRTGKKAASLGVSTRNQAGTSLFALPHQQAGGVINQMQKAGDMVLAACIGVSCPFQQR